MRARELNALSDLVADLDDFVPDARGTMLIVGASDKETPLAVELARNMNADWSSDSTTVDFGQGHGRPSAPGGAPAGQGEMRGTDADAGARLALPAFGSASSSGGASSGGDFESAPTHARHDLLAPPTLVQSGAPYGLFSGPSNPTQQLVTTPWDTSLSGAGLRRQARLADRVLVVVPSGGITVPELREVRTLLGREEGVGFVIVGMTPELAKLPDRCGPVDEFWAATRQTNGAEG